MSFSRCLSMIWILASLPSIYIFSSTSRRSVVLSVTVSLVRTFHGFVYQILLMALEWRQIILLLLCLVMLVLFLVWISYLQNPKRFFIVPTIAICWYDICIVIVSEASHQAEVAGRYWSGQFVSRQAVVTIGTIDYIASLFYDVGSKTSYPIIFSSCFRTLFLTVNGKQRSCKKILVTLKYVLGSLYFPNLSLNTLGNVSGQSLADTLSPSFLFGRFHSSWVGSSGEVHL